MNIVKIQTVRIVIDAKIVKSVLVNVALLLLLYVINVSTLTVQTVPNARTV